MENPYDVLGIPRNAPSDDIKKAYFSLIRKHPPEKNPQGFKRIRLAYDSLKDMDKRSRTDLFLFSDPYQEFKVDPVEEAEYVRKLDMRVVISLLSDLARTDFSNDFNKIKEGLDQ